MNKLKVIYYPTYLEVQGYKLGDNSEIEKFLSVWDKGIFDYKFKGFQYDEETKVAKFPSGINTTRFEGKLPTHETENKRNEHYFPTRNNRAIHMNFSPRNEVQEKTMEFLNESEYNPNSFQKLLSLNTGDGKTFCAVLHVARTSRIPMIFVDKEKLSKQWRERITEYTDTIEDDIYTIAGKRSIQKLMKMNKTDLSKIKFFIATHKTISKYMEEESLQELFDKLDISLKIFDEAHLEYENMFNIDMNTKCPSLYLTATPGRSNRDEDKVFKNFIYSIPKFTSDSFKIKNVEENYHRIVICKMNTKPSEEFLATFAKASFKRGFNIPTYSNYLMEERYDVYFENIYKILYNLVLNKGNLKRKTVILVKQVNLVDSIAVDIQEKLDELSLNLKVSRFHNKVPKKEKDLSLDADIIVSTDSSLGTAIDIPGLECIISTIPTSSPILSTQMLGRLRFIPDREVFYFDLVDIGFKECMKQLSARKTQVYNKKAKKIQEIKM